MQELKLDIRMTLRWSNCNHP